MRLPRRVQGSVYTVCDAKQTLGESVGDVEDCETALDGPFHRERRDHREKDFDEGPPPRRRRRVVAVILPTAAACVAIAIALMLLRPAGGERRPRLGSAEGASRLHETNVPATNTPAGTATPIGRATRISRQAPALGGAPAARAGVTTAPRRSGRAIEAPQSIVPAGPIVLLDAARPVVPPAPVLAEAEFGFER
jgi:hypothetical protein